MVIVGGWAHPADKAHQVKGMTGSNAVVTVVWFCGCEWLRFLAVLRDCAIGFAGRNWYVCGILMTG